MNTTTRDIDYVKLVKDLIYERFKTPYEEKINKNGIINSFLKEHHQIFALSEQLNWTDTWTTPEFRIGT